MRHVGKWAFILGLVIAVLAGIGLEETWFTWVLAVLGLVVGFLNVTSGETQGFLLAAIALMLTANAVQEIPYVGDQVTLILGNVVAFMAAAVLVVALRALFDTARD
jgi:hypothetical protein